MRTTLDLPDDLLKRAKITAVERGTTLRDLVSRALTRELDSSETSPLQGRRVEVPIVKSSRHGQVVVTDEDIRRFEFEDDVKRAGF